MKKLYLVTMVLATAMLVVLPSNAQANLLSNPGFEIQGAGGVLDADNWLESGDAGRHDWADFAELPGSTWGIGIVNWGGNDTGEVKQNVSVSGGTPYIFSLQTERDSGTVTSGSYYLQLAWYNGTTALTTSTLDITTSISDTWSLKTLSATAPATADNVDVLFGVNNVNLAGKFDQADFAVVPEPTSLLLLGSGLIGLLALRKRTIK